MAYIFKYNDKVYQTMNLNKKLKRLKVNQDDIDILYQGDLTQAELEKKYLDITDAIKAVPTEAWHNVKLYTFRNTKTGGIIVSIYDCLDNLKECVNVNEYERIV